MVTAKDIISTEFSRWKQIMDDLDFAEAHVTDPTHGGKVTCYKCNGFIQYKDYIPYLDHQHKDEFPKAHFHRECYNQYEHYYGLDKPID